MFPLKQFRDVSVFKKKNPNPLFWELCTCFMKTSGFILLWNNIIEAILRMVYEADLIVVKSRKDSNLCSQEMSQRITVKGGIKQVSPLET